MTAPAPATPYGGTPLRPPAPPPNPKIQAVEFALKLAEIRANTGVAGERATTVAQLVSDAGEIASFIGTGSLRNVGA